jgi:hypothetical protein
MVGATARVTIGVIRRGNWIPDGGGERRILQARERRQPASEEDDEEKEESTATVHELLAFSQGAYGPMSFARLAPERVALRYFCGRPRVSLVKGRITPPSTRRHPVLDQECPENCPFRF